MESGRVWKHNFWAWDEVDHCRLVSETRSGKVFRVLQMVGHGGGILESLALSPKVPEAKIIAAIEGRGKRIEP